MKPALILLLTLLGICSCSRPPEEEDPTPGEVTVRVLKKSLPAAERKRGDFLWWNCANKSQGRRFSSYTSENWKSNYMVFSKALLQKAEGMKLDSASLGRVLDLVLKDSQDKMAYLPIGAYQSSLGGAPVWIVTVKWESAPSGSNVQRAFALGHIRAFGFEQKTLKQVAFTTCD
jgi:hypothetical protein